MKVALPDMTPAASAARLASEPGLERTAVEAGRDWERQIEALAAEAAQHAALGLPLVRLRRRRDRFQFAQQQLDMFAQRVAEGSGRLIAQWGERIEAYGLKALDRVWRGLKVAIDGGQGEPLQRTETCCRPSTFCDQAVNRAGDAAVKCSQLREWKLGRFIIVAFSHDPVSSKGCDDLRKPRPAESPQGGLGGADGEAQP